MNSAGCERKYMFLLFNNLVQKKVSDDNINYNILCIGNWSFENARRRQAVDFLVNLE